MAADGMLNIRTFGKRQVLMNQDDDADNVGVMLSGTAFLESMNQEGQRRILDYYEPKESFTRKCFPDVEGVCYVISRSSCQVAFLNDRKLSSAYKKYEKRGRTMRFSADRSLACEFQSNINGCSDCSKISLRHFLHDHDRDHAHGRGRRKRSCIRCRFCLLCGHSSYRQPL